MKKFKTFILCSLLATALVNIELMSTVHAQDRSKNLDFDDSLVEGVNKKPLDSYSQISDAQKKRRRAHLYRKRSIFDHEIKESFASMRFGQ